MLEFTLVGIPIMFVLISIFEISRGMWMYHTMAYAVKQGVRYTIVHGFNCTTNAQTNNTCNVNMGPATNTCATDNTINPTIAEVIRCAGVGLDPATTQLTFTSLGGTVAACTLDTSGGTNPCTGAAIWPPTGYNSAGDPITIKVTTPFRSALTLFWPGARASKFGTFVLGAQSSDRMQY